MLAATTTSSPYPFFKHFIKPKHGETRMQQSINHRDSLQERNRCLRAAKTEVRDSSSRYQPALDDSTDGLSPGGQTEIKFESTETAETAENAVIDVPALPPSTATAGEPPSRGIPIFNNNCSMQQPFNLEFSRDWNTSQTLRGASASRSNGEEIGEARRLQSAQSMFLSPGDEDFEFLGNLLREAEASPSAAAFPNGRGITSFPGAAARRVSSSWIPAQNHSPVFSPYPGIVSAGAGLAIQVPRVGSSNSVAGNTAALHELVEESKFHAADKVAACIWLAGDRVQESLFTRVTDTWAIMEAEVPIIAAIGRNFSEVVAGRLKATRLSVEAEMRVADKVAAARGEMALVEPDWRGNHILRGDVLSRLEAFRIYNIREAATGEPGFSLAKLRQDLVQRLRDTREVVIDRINSNYKAAATAAGVHGFQLSPAVSDNEVLMGIDDAAQCVLQQLKATYYLVAEEVRHPTVRVPIGNIGKRLLEKQQAAKTAAAKELFKGHVRSETDSCAGVTSAHSPIKITTNTRRLPSGASPSTKKTRRHGSGGRRCKNVECSLHPHFGFTRPEYCSRHKLPGMFNVKGRRCMDSECSRTPVYGKKGDPHPTYCAAHKLDNMIDIKNPTCREQSCNRQPSFGLPQDRRATYCASHMLGGMVNVRRMLAAKGLSRRLRRERLSAADTEACIAKLSASRRGETRADIRGPLGGR